MKPQLLILGAGGHSKVLINALLSLPLPVFGILDKNKSKIGQTLLGVPILGSDSDLAKFPHPEFQLINGIGSTQNLASRRDLFARFKSDGYVFSNVVHPSATIGLEVHLGEGVQVMAGAVIQTSVIIGKNTIINTKASVDHDCVIGDHVHLAPGVTISGNVTIGNEVHVGTGATIIEGITVGNGAFIAAGAVVVANVPDGVRVMGVPAREVKQ